MKDREHLNFSRKDPAKFFRTLNGRVNSYFIDHNIEKSGNWKLHLKTIIMFSIYLTPLLFTFNIRCTWLGSIAIDRYYGRWHGWRRYERDA